MATAPLSLNWCCISRGVYNGLVLTRISPAFSAPSIATGNTSAALRDALSTATHPLAGRPLTICELSSLSGSQSVAEQACIVARVSELRRLCAALRQRLTASQTTQSHLAEAMVEATIA